MADSNEEKTGPTLHKIRSDTGMPCPRCAKQHRKGIMDEYKDMSFEPPAFWWICRECGATMPLPSERDRQIKRKYRPKP